MVYDLPFTYPANRSENRLQNRNFYLIYPCEYIGTKITDTPVVPEVGRHSAFGLVTCGLEKYH